jgi:hypothetical protein
MELLWPPRRERRHSAAFEVWYEADRDYKAVMKDCRVSEHTARNWGEWFGWHAKAAAGCCDTSVTSRLRCGRPDSKGATDGP